MGQGSVNDVPAEVALSREGSSSEKERQRLVLRMRAAVTVSVWGWAEGQEHPRGLEEGWPWCGSTDLVCECPQTGGGSGRERGKCCLHSEDGRSAAVPGTACPSALWVAALAAQGICQQKSAQVTPVPLTRRHGTPGTKQSCWRECGTGPCCAHQHRGLQWSECSWCHPFIRPFSVAGGGGSLLFSLQDLVRAATGIASAHLNQCPGWCPRDLLSAPSGDSREHTWLLAPPAPMGCVRAPAWLQHEG